MHRVTQTAAGRKVGRWIEARVADGGGAAMLHVAVIEARELVDSHSEDVQVAKDAASGTHQLAAVSVTVTGDADGLKESVDSASKRAAWIVRPSSEGLAAKRKRRNPNFPGLGGRKTTWLHRRSKCASKPKTTDGLWGGEPRRRTASSSC